MIKNSQHQINYFCHFHSQIKLPVTENINIKMLGFNIKSSILVIGKTDGNIQIFQFKFGALKLIKELYGQNSIASSLLFTKKSNQIILVNNKMQIFSEVGIVRGCHIFQSDLHKPNCLILNKDENLLIYSSNDRAIRMLRKHNNQWSFHQKFEVSYYGYIISLSLNESENFLVCLSEFENKIFICRRNQVTNMWSIFQTINYRESQALQACFINDSIFILQLYKEENFQFYHQNQGNQHFELFKPIIEGKLNNSLKIPQRFQLQMIQQKQCLMYRKDNCINLLLIKSQDSFELQKLISLVDSNFIFRATNDGQYILIWQKNYNILLVLLLKES
ncbi:unnamed protein product [Paramecium octaurelia]|uniref:Uncharacterized protein n=1 Tax=Paramecium octaurelia TaxID=43137 RepID=A0A8S1V6M6_PAROT|nr:unnamed protein product [Paramecium octaurelia]